MRDRQLASFLVLFWFAPFAGAQEDKVHRALTPEQLESTLERGKIQFKKLADAKANSFSYDYQIKGFNLRLHYAAGRHLMLNTLFGPLTLDKANQWNLSGKSSRAAVGEESKGVFFTVLDSHLNLKGGVTGVAVQEFIDGFANELAEFQMFVQAAQPRKDIAKEEITFKEVSAERMERTLADMNIKFAKVQLKGGNPIYRYQSKETTIVLTNWGKDMMLEAKFPKLPLDKVNQYNLDRKFIRTVAYKNKLGEYTGLEANLNFQGGVTDSIVRNFIEVFEQDAREFGVYAKKASE
jgi:hypothetical protein